MADSGEIMANEEVGERREARNEAVGVLQAQVSQSDDGRAVRIASQQEKKYISNSISTSKYNVFTFLPRFLFEQFRKYSNMFFLIVALLQQIPNVSPTGRFTTVIPLTIILCVSALKEVVEDIKRHRADMRINRARVDVVRPISYKEGESGGGRFQLQNVRWMDVQVGDVVRVTDRHFFPADLVLLSSSEPQGMCYIETSNLDGETNLKIRQADARTCDLTSVDQLAHFVAERKPTIECEMPNTRLYEFIGTLTVSGNDAHLMDSNANPNFQNVVPSLNASQSPSDSTAIPKERGGRFALSSVQLLPRGSVLRNTAWLFGVAVYTGGETKMMLNSTHAPLKRSTMERRSNVMVLFLLAIVALLTLTCAIGQSIWTWAAGNQAKGWYLPPESTVPNFAFMVLTSFIMFHTLVPISLQVTLEMVRFMQSFFINWDVFLYDAATDTPAAARTSNLNEELGQIKYIFSDKTGTLTRNMMEFCKCSIAGVKYGDSELSDERQVSFDPQTPQTSSAAASDRPLQDLGEFRSTRFSETRQLTNVLHGNCNDLLDASSSSHQCAVRDFVEMMAVCHTVVPERSENGTLRYLASSPDEGALVRAAASFGYIFSARSHDSVTIDVSLNHSTSKSLRFEVLNVIDFTSSRKRMTAIVRTPDGQLRLLLKGADDVVFTRLANMQRYADVVSSTRSHLEQFAATGLRTLCFAMRDLSEAEYSAWSARFQSASTAINHREEKVAQCAELIERELQLLGATAIEDRLQDEVPETIAAFLEADIRVWVLTGDKQETAVNIGYASRLLDAETTLIMLNCTDSDAVKQALDARMVDDSRKHLASAIVHENDRPSTSHAASTSNLKYAGSKQALIVDGGTLRFALMEEHRSRFLELALDCTSVICCRVSPLQKAQIVELVRANVHDAVTLAIGDGANDVGMIQAAHVGVGISGMEGLQAACASDYSIAQFRFLKRLLFVHGAWNYTRMCKLILYSFYKNACMYITQFWFALDNGFSGQILFDSMWIALYNVVFTSAPPLALGLFERHCSDKTLMKIPRLYTWSQSSSGFNFRLLFTWLLTSLVHSLVVYYLTTSSISHDVLYADGQVGGSIMYSGNYIMTFIILVVCLKAGLEHTTWNYFSHAAIWGSIALWFVLLVVYSHLFPFLFSADNMNGLDYQMFSCPSYWLLMILTPTAALMIDVTIKVFRKVVFGDDLLGQIQDFEAQLKNKNVERDLLRQPHRNYRSLSTLTLVNAVDNAIIEQQSDNNSQLQSQATHAPAANRGSITRDELTFSSNSFEAFRGYAFSQEERGAVSQAEYIRRYESDNAKPSGS